MERLTRISKNAATLIGAKLVTSGLSFLMANIINRELGPVNVGIYNYAFVLYTIFQILPDFGLGNITVRDASRDRSKLDYYFRNIVQLRLLLGMAAFLLIMLTNAATLLLSSRGSVDMQKFWVVFAVSFCLFIEQPLSNTLLENFIAVERLSAVALVYLILGVMRVGLSIWVVLAGFRHVLVLLVLIYIFCYLYSIFHFLFLYRRMLRRDPTLATGSWSPEPASPESASGGVPAAAEGAADPRRGAEKRLFWLYMLRSSWPLAVVSGALIVYAVIEVPILSWFKGDEQVGLYAAAAMFAKALVFLTVAINMAVLPAISKVGGRFPERLGPIWENLVFYSLVVIIPLAVLIPVLARPFLIYQSHNFISAYPVVWITMAAMNFTVMSAVSFPFFIVINKQKRVTWVILAGLVMKFTLDLAIIPFWGFTGAAVAVLAGEMAVFLLLFFSLTRELRHRVDIPRLGAVPASLAALAYAAALFLHRLLVQGKDTLSSSAVWALNLALILFIIYLACAFLCGLFGKDRLQALNRLLTTDEQEAEGEPIPAPE